MSLSRKGWVYDKAQSELNGIITSLSWMATSRGNEWVWGISEGQWMSLTIRELRDRFGKVLEPAENVWQTCRSPEVWKVQLVSEESGNRRDSVHCCFRRSSFPTEDKWHEQYELDQMKGRTAGVVVGVQDGGDSRCTIGRLNGLFIITRCRTIFKLLNLLNKKWRTIERVQIEASLGFALP